ncbi:origin of replication complex subunit 6-like isoform X1 [Olea europaea var. sylvestris]|uniref:origin of replication complex subunit 6-like isoform X1 n=1 Tax=Olea europaea var. sylvestris TaxID=158386 RepID=UPI000C1D6388|nr:origin of replication complex subunit 6-like isoform X1 [Olea europaea var. sylvestris]
MDMSGIAKKLGFSEFKQLILHAAELRRLADIQFDSSIIGIGEICKAIICLEIAASRMEVIFDHHAAVKLSGLFEKAYNRSFNSMQNSIGIKKKLHIRELAIQFGCIRLIPFVQKGLSLYKDRFIASLPPSRKASTDIMRPVFTAAGFYLCAKRHNYMKILQLKIDKSKLIELAGTSEYEFSSVSASMTDLCFDVFGKTKEKRDSKEDNGNHDVLPEKRRVDDDGPLSDDGEERLACMKRKQMEKHVLEE